MEQYFALQRGRRSGKPDRLQSLRPLNRTFRRMAAGPCPVNPKSLGTRVATGPIHPVRKVAEVFAANRERLFAGVIRTLAKANRIARRVTLVALAGAA